MAILGEVCVTGYKLQQKGIGLAISEKFLGNKGKNRDHNSRTARQPIKYCIQLVLGLQT